MAHPQHNFTSNFNGSDGHNAELTLNINGVEKKYTPAGNDQTYNVPGVARIDINLDGADLVQAIQTALDGAAQPVLVEMSIYGEEYVYQYIGEIDGQWYFGTCITTKIVTITVAKEDGAVNGEQIPVANGVVIVESDGLNVYSRLRTALALGQLPVLSYVGANPVYAQYEKTADNGDLIFVGALASASDTYVQYNIYTVASNNTVTVTTRAASAGGGGTPDDENGFFNSSLYQTPGDGVTESLTLNDFRIKQGTSIHGSNIEFVVTHTEGGIDFGEVWLNPGTYILNIRYTLQWVGNPRGTFASLVCNVGGQPFDFSFEQENTLITSQIRVVTARQKVSIAFPFDADTPPMGIWVETLSIAQIASNTHPAVVHDTTLAGSGTAGSPLGVTTDAFGKVKDIPTSISQFRTGDVIPLDGPNGPAKMPASDLQDAILGGPIDEAVQAWLDEHPEATTTVQDGSLTELKFSDALKLQTIKDYVTPEMFGAKGDGVTDDTEALQSCLDSGKSVFLNKKRYLCGMLTLNSNSVTILGNGATLQAVERTQRCVLLCNSRYCHISDLQIVGFDSYDYDTLSANDSSGIEFTISGCKNIFQQLVITGFAKLIYASGNSFWDNHFFRVQFGGTGVYAVKSDHTVLDCTFYGCSYNSCKEYISLNGGNIGFYYCNFGNSLNESLGKFINDCRSVRFVGCNFEEAKPTKYYMYFATSMSSFIFSGCHFHQLKKSSSADSRCGFIQLFSGDIRNHIRFEKCSFQNNDFYCDVDYRTSGGESTIIEFDYPSILAMSGNNGIGHFNVAGVYSGNNPMIDVGGIYTKSATPTTTFMGSYKRLFKGIVARVLLGDYHLFIFDGNDWVPQVSVPQFASDENTYTLKNVAGTLTWVQDT